jgi:hypothetical protein
MYVNSQLQVSATFTPRIEYALHRTLHVVKMYFKYTRSQEYYFGYLYYLCSVFTAANLCFVRIALCKNILNLSL